MPSDSSIFRTAAAYAAKVDAAYIAALVAALSAASTLAA